MHPLGGDEAAALADIDESMLCLLYQCSNSCGCALARHAVAAATQVLRSRRGKLCEADRLDMWLYTSDIHDATVNICARCVHAGSQWQGLPHC